MIKQVTIKFVNFQAILVMSFSLQMKQIRVWVRLQSVADKHAAAPEVTQQQVEEDANELTKVRFERSTRLSARLWILVMW